MERAILSKSLDEKQAARLLAVAVQTLRNWRHQRRGPAYIKMGRAVRYQIKDLEDFMNKRKIDPDQNEVIYFK